MSAGVSTEFFEIIQPAHLKQQEVRNGYLEVIAEPSKIIWTYNPVYDIQNTIPRCSLRYPSADYNVCDVHFYYYVTDVPDSFKTRKYTNIRVAIHVQ